MGSTSLKILGKEVCRIRTGLAGFDGYSKVGLFQVIMRHETDDSSIMSRVPTDAQLTIHLLRVAEALETPLPVPP